MAAAFSLGLLLLLAGSASAHAKVISADPGLGSTIALAPTKITVTTIENMKPGAKFSNLFVYGPSGALVSQGDATIPLNNPKEMSVTIKPEKGNGVYIVRWITVSADDGDPDEGAFIFTVNSAGPVASTSTPTKQTSTPTSAASSGIPLWAPIVTGIVALLVGLGAGAGLGRRSAIIIPTGQTSAMAANEKERTPTNRS
jgi:methionine-rich copper-binding protein CopC